ncbi:MAG: FIST N-terminal domain-containing protein [Spirochaetota bacterium]
MSTKAGVGNSINRNPVEAGKEAVAQALENAGINKPDFLFVFATVGYNQEVLLKSIREASFGAPLSGCSGEGIITRGTAVESNFCVAVMAIKSTELRFDNYYVEDVKNEAGTAGETLAKKINKKLTADNLACFIFPDGLTFNFAPFLSMFEKSLQDKKPLLLFGGLAADNCESQQTFQYHNDLVLSEAVSCVLMSGIGNIAWGITHGCIPVGTRRTITKGSGNIIYEIDGMPAIDALSDYFEDGWKTQWNKISLNLCLGFKTPENIKSNYGEYVVRYMMSKDGENGSVKIQTDVVNGTEFWIVRRDKDLIKNGVRELSRQITEKIGDKKPKFVLHFDCVGRGKLVFREREKIKLIKTLQKDIGEDIPWIGFYTYGEIGPVADSNFSHNLTAVVAAIY